MTESDTSVRRPRLTFMLSRFLDGGIDTVLLEYLRAIDPEHYDVHLVVVTGLGDLEVHRHHLPDYVTLHYLVKDGWLTSARRRKIKEGKLSLIRKICDEAVLHPLRKLLAAVRLRRIAGRSDAIVDFDGRQYAMLSRIARQKPVAGFCHFSIAENLNRSRRHTLRQMHGMARYRRIVLLSDAMMREGRELFPELKEKYVRIYNGYDREALRRRGAADVTLPPYPYFVAVNRLEESQKDITTLLHAYAKFSRDYEGAPHLVIIGMGRDRERLQELALKLGLGEQVHFMGFQPDAAPWIANSLGLVLSSHYEGFGLVLAEAMILGRPVIASDCPTGPAEVLDGGRAGLLVTPGDCDELADALRVVADDPKQREELAAAALRRSEAFDIHRSVKALLLSLNPSTKENNG